MLPLLGLIGSIALIDRANLGVARISGMESDLVRILSDAPVSYTFELTISYQRLDIGERYSIVSMIFFPPYILL